MEQTWTITRNVKYYICRYNTKETILIGVEIDNLSMILIDDHLQHPLFYGKSNICHLFVCACDIL